MSRFLLLSVVLSVLLSVAVAGGGHGFGGGFQQAILVQPVVPAVAAVQPIMQTKAPRYVQPIVQEQKRVNYAQPIVTYAQPIVQALDTTAPVMQDQSYTAAPIVQPTFQTAPVQNVQAISATAPTINKGYGSGLGLGVGGYGGLRQF